VHNLLKLSSIPKIEGPKLASQTRVAFPSILPNTGSNSPGDELITSRTSEAAVCCSRDCRSSLNSCAFSIAIAACAAKFFRLDLSFREGTNFLTKNSDIANQRAFAKHWHHQERSGAGRISQCDARRFAFKVGRTRSEIVDIAIYFVRAR
jgi:hypothetical protein